VGACKKNAGRGEGVRRGGWGGAGQAAAASTEAECGSPRGRERKALLRVRRRPHLRVLLRILLLPLVRLRRWQRRVLLLVRLRLLSLHVRLRLLRLPLGIPLSRGRLHQQKDENECARRGVPRQVPVLRRAPRAAHAVDQAHSGE